VAQAAVHAAAGSELSSLYANPHAGQPCLPAELQHLHGQVALLQNSRPRLPGLGCRSLSPAIPLACFLGHNLGHQEVEIVRHDERTAAVGSEIAGVGQKICTVALEIEVGGVAA